MSSRDGMNKKPLDTMSTIEIKSSEIIELGKLKHRIKDLDDKIICRKKGIGNIVYEAFKKEEEPSRESVGDLIGEIKEIETEILRIYEKIALIERREEVKR